MSVEKKKAVMVLSWGLDSTTLLYKLVNEWYECYALTFIYWQKDNREVECARKTCEKLWVNHKIINVSFLKDLLKSSLTDDNEEIPDWDYREEKMKSTVVPSRNLIFASMAIWYWQSIWAEIVSLWVHLSDYEIYPDCRKEFIEKLDEIAHMSDWNEISIYCPFTELTKTQIVKLWTELWVDYSLTSSCYRTGWKPCWKCGSCVGRLEAFHENWLEDVLEYEE